MLAALLPHIAFASGNEVTAVPADPTVVQQQNLSVPDALRNAVQHAIDAQDFDKAEALLIDALKAPLKKVEEASILNWLGSIYLQNHDPFHAAVAWKKSEAICPLSAQLRFSLAMAYVAMKKPAWARNELERLSQAEASNALYPYWLGRIDYDGHLYPSARQHLQLAVTLDPKFAKAWDNLGLVAYYLNENDNAIADFRKAIDLEKDLTHPSAWPYLNLAITEQFLGRNKEAEEHLRAAIALSDNFAQAHFQLGTVLEESNQLAEAANEQEKAAALDAGYMEPHMALARLYHRMGDDAKARIEVERYRKMHARSSEIR